MNAQRKNENKNASFDKYLTKKSEWATRTSKERTLLGRTVKEVKRVVTLTTETIVKKVAPTPDPWDSDDWMAMM